MWKRDESVKPTPGQAGTPAAIPAAPSSVAPAPSLQSDVRRPTDRDVVNIGKSVVIRGELNGSEDLTIEGHVEGKIELRDHVLTIGPNGKIKAQVFAKAVIVLGEVQGNVSASEKVDIRDNGSVDGDIISPRVAIAEGAHFRGSVDMQRKPVPPSAQAQAPKVVSAPAAASEPAPSATETDTAPAAAQAKPAVP